MFIKRSEYDKLIDLVNMSDKEIEMLRCELDNYKKENEELRYEKIKLSSDKEIAAENYKELKTSNEELIISNKNLEAKVIEYEDQIAKLTAKIDELKSSAAKKKTRSVTSESVKSK